MSVNFQDTSVTNKMVPAITFRNGANNVLTLQSGETAVLTITFDGILFAAAWHPVVQHPNVPVEVPPGSFAYVIEAEGAVLVKCAMLDGQVHTIRFV